MKANLKTWPATPVDSSPKSHVTSEPLICRSCSLAKEEQPGSAGHPERRDQRSEVSQIGTPGATDGLLISDF
jgi:hypothetical protein